VAENSETPIRLEWRIRASVLPTYGAASTGRQEYKRYKIKWQWDETGIFGIGVSNPKTTQNSGTLWRSAPHCGTDVIEKMVEGKFLRGMAGRKSKTPVPPTRTGACSEDLPVQWKGQPQRAKESIEGTKQLFKRMFLIE